MGKARVIFKKVAQGERYSNPGSRYSMLGMQVSAKYGVFVDGTLRIKLFKVDIFWNGYLCDDTGMKLGKVVVCSHLFKQVKEDAIQYATENLI